MTYVLLRQFQYGHLGTATLCQDSHFIVDHLRIPGAALEASGQGQVSVKLLFSADVRLVKSISNSKQQWEQTFHDQGPDAIPLYKTP